MWVEYNPNPAAMRNVEDCAVRAIAKVLNTDWESAYAMLALNGFAMGDMPNANSVIGSVLRQNNFKRFNIPENCPDCYTIKDFSKEYNKGTYVVGTGSHVVAVVNGNYFDSWDSGNEYPLYAWVKS